MKLTMVPHVFPHEGTPSLNDEPIAYRVTHAPKGREFLIVRHNFEWKVSEVGREVSRWNDIRFNTAGEALLALEAELKK